RTVRVAKGVVGIARENGRLLVLVAANRRQFDLEAWNGGKLVKLSTGTFANPPLLFTTISGEPAVISRDGIRPFDGQGGQAIAARLDAPSDAFGAGRSGCIRLGPLHLSRLQLRRMGRWSNQSRRQDG